MMKLVSALIALAGMSTAVWAACGDIQKACHDNYVLDMGACQRNYSGSAQSDCIRRAEQQFNYCVKNGGC